MRLVAVPIGIALVAATGCTKTKDPCGDEATIRKVDGDMVATLNAHDVDRWLTFFAGDAKMMPPGAPAVVGKEGNPQPHRRTHLARVHGGPSFGIGRRFQER